MKSEYTLEFAKDGLPNGWTRNKLEDIATVILGLSPPSATYNTSKNGLPFFQGKADFGQRHPTTRIWCSSPKRIVEKDTLLLSVRAPVGSTNISLERCSIGRGLAGIKPHDGVSTTEFFFYLLRNKQSELERMGTGTTFSAIRSSDIRELPVFLPPLNEQKRILSKIEAIFAQIDKLEELIATCLNTLEQMRKSTLKTAFEGGLVPQDSSDEPTHNLLERIRSEKHDQ